MTAGNLSTHLRVLEEATYVTITRAHSRRIHVTFVAITKKGSCAFEDFTSTLRTKLVRLTFPPPRSARQRLLLHENYCANFFARNENPDQKLIVLCIHQFTGLSMSDSYPSVPLARRACRE
jgi:hypothetical protein